jgi:hypothetical protein
MKNRITKEEVTRAAQRWYPTCWGTDIEFMQDNIAVVTHSIDPKDEGEFEVLLIIWKDDNKKIHVKDLDSEKDDKPVYGMIEVTAISQNKVNIRGEAILWMGHRIFEEKVILKDGIVFENL